LKSILNNIHKAAHDTAQFVEGQIRQSALAHGWDKKVVENTHVRFQNNKFNVYVHDKYVGDALTHEYGNETSRPTAVIRKYNNNPAGAGANFVQNLGKHMEGKK
jgi:hypothetical protein